MMTFCSRYMEVVYDSSLVTIQALYFTGYQTDNKFCPLTHHYPTSLIRPSHLLHTHLSASPLLCSDTELENPGTSSSSC